MYRSQQDFARMSAPERERFFATHVPIGRDPRSHRGCYISNTDRFAGTYVLGVQGSGKSGLLQNMIAYDMRIGNAVVVVDPHGDQTEQVINAIPQHRMKDLFILDLEDEEFPFGLNLFAHGVFKTSLERDQLVNRVLHVFHVLWPETQHQQNIPLYLPNAIRALIDTDGSTLYDMYEFLTNPAVRAQFLSRVQDRSVRDFWLQQYNGLSDADQRQRIGALITRLNTLFVGRTFIRNVVGQRKNTIDLGQAIRQKQIIIIKLPLKALPEESSLIGTIIMAQIHAAIFNRSGEVSLYLDEFQHFATSDIEELFTEGRKFGVQLTIAHQYRKKLPQFLQEATQTARNKVCFSLVADDAKDMAPYFPAQDEQPKLEAGDVESDAIKILLDDGCPDIDVTEFIDTYLRPLQGLYGLGRGQIKITNLGITPLRLWHSVEDYRKAYNPTYYLNALFREIMRTGNPEQQVTAPMVQGFSNLTKHTFYKYTERFNPRQFTSMARFPPYLVGTVDDGATGWLRDTRDGHEQFLHFAFLLRQTMRYLAAHPFVKPGKASATPKVDVAGMLTRLPKRVAFVRIGEAVGTIMTHNRAPALAPDAVKARRHFIQQQTRQRYCHPRSEVEKAFAPTYQPQPQPVAQKPMPRWANP